MMSAPPPPSSAPIDLKKSSQESKPPGEGAMT